MKEETKRLLQVRNAAILDAHFDRGISAPTLAAEYGLALTTVNKLIRMGKDAGRVKLKPTSFDRRLRENRRSLSSYHALLAMMVTRFCTTNGHTDTTFGDLVGLSRTKVGELKSGYHDLTVLQMLKVCAVIDVNPEDIFRPVTAGSVQRKARTGGI